MSADRIAQLHEQASEHYLNGNYDGALQAWRDVLALDPANEQAMDGVRMASQFAAPSNAVDAVDADVDPELDQGLRVFDSLGTPAMDRKPAPARAAVKQVSELERQGDGIDFGDLAGVGAIPLGAVDAQPVTEAPAEEAAPAAEEESFGLEPVASSAASVELSRRVSDLLTEAQAKADAGEKDEALSILSRLAILDDENPEAAALRAKLLESGPSDLDKIEESIIEGVAALESDRLDDAEKHFHTVLDLSPEHREAKHYLEKVQERRAGVSPTGAHEGEDLLGGDLLGGAPPAAAPAEVPSSAPVPLATAMPAKAARSKAAALPDAAVLPTMRKGGLPLKWVVAGGLLVAGAVGAFMMMPQLLGGKPAFTPPPPAVKKPAATAAKKPIEAAAPPMSADERARIVATSVQRGRERMTAGDFGAAVVAYNDALRADPTNVDAKAGLNEAGERYKSRKAEQDALESIKLGFRDGEYTSSLRLAYRLPPSIPESYVNAIKAAGWYNLGIVALRAGDCKEAIAHFDETLNILPGDPDATKQREFAVRYADAPKDRTFLDQVEALAFRPLPAQ